MVVDKTCRDTNWFTPPRILEPVRAYFGGPIGLDPASHISNPTKAKIWYTQGGLTMAWAQHNTFLNPPFGRELRDWLAKIRQEAEDGCHLIALLPGQRFEQAYFQENIFIEELGAICFVRRRVSFLGLDGKRRRGNPYGSMLYLFNGQIGRFAEHFAEVGAVIKFERIC